MHENLRLMTVGAHPDDETLGFGGVLAAAASEGIETHVLTATLGQRGWVGDPAANPGAGALGRIRERELHAAALVLGVKSVTVLGHMDGELDGVPAPDLAREIASAIRRVRPHVIVTFGHDGVYGHPDHIAASQSASSAIVLAADVAFESGDAPHSVSKLYHRAPSAAFLEAYAEGFGELMMEIDGAPRRSPGWADWAITTRVDARAHWRTVWAAAREHRSQLPGYARLAALPESHHEAMWGNQEYYRAMSTVNGGRALERDLFEGLRAAAPVNASRASSSS